MVKKMLIAAVSALLLLAFAQPAQAATPAQVTKVQVVGASTTSLTLDWPTIKGATRYDIFYSTNYDTLPTVSTKVKTGASSDFTVTKLLPGVTYCFMVRAVSGSTVGTRSQRTCKPTIRPGGATQGLNLRVVTFNSCSRVCGWSAAKAAAVDKLMIAAQPDIVAGQEANNFWSSSTYPIPPGYALAAKVDSSKSLYFNTAKFQVARRLADNKPNSGSYKQCDESFAAWAEFVTLVDGQPTGKHFIVSSAHLQNGKTSADAATRSCETTELLQQVGAESSKVGNVPVIYAGDFNSNKNRGSLDTVGQVMNRNGYWDAFDLAQTLSNPNWNSSFPSGTPVYAVRWGDHVDHIWVTQDVGVRGWIKLPIVAPYPSDHFPVQVDLTISQ